MILFFYYHPILINLFFVCNFYLQRAESSVQRTQVLNPTVKVSSDSRPVSEINEQFIQKFTVVLATNCALNDITKLNELCRKHKIKFYSGHVWGKIGYYFVDLHRHYYVK